MTIGAMVYTTARHIGQRSSANFPDSEHDYITIAPYLYLVPSDHVAVQPCTRLGAAESIGLLAQVRVALLVDKLLGQHGQGNVVPPGRTQLATGAAIVDKL